MERTGADCRNTGPFAMVADLVVLYDCSGSHSISIDPLAKDSRQKSQTVHGNGDAET